MAAKAKPLGPGVQRLPGADLRGEQLQGRDLQRVKLPGALLAGASLKGSDLRGAELKGAVWQEGNTDLIFNPPDVAGLEGAALGEAWAAWARKEEFFKSAEEGEDACLKHGVDGEAGDLSGAKLAGADLTGADLREVNLDGVEWSEGLEWKGVKLPVEEGKEGKIHEQLLLPALAQATF